MLDPALAELAGDYEIRLISPLATAQRSVALQGINSFMAFVGQAAQFDQSILDNINVDEAAREYANITGVQLGVLRPQEQVDMIRAQRAEAMKAQQQKEQQMQEQAIQAQMNKEMADAQKTQAEAGLKQLETQQIARNMGMM